MLGCNAAWGDLILVFPSPQAEEHQPHNTNLAAKYASDY